MYPKKSQSDVIENIPLVLKNKEKYDNLYFETKEKEGYYAVIKCLDSCYIRSINITPIY